MHQLATPEIWFVCGSQHLYGPSPLEEVAETLDASGQLPLRLVYKALLTTPHGDREAGFTHTWMRLGRKVVVGHLTDAKVQAQLGAWVRVAHAWSDLTSEHLEDFAEIAGLELVVIDDHTLLREFRNELRQNDLYYTVAQGLRN